MERKKIGDLLVSAGVISIDQLKQALQEKKSNQRIGAFLVEKGYVTEKQLLKALEVQLGIPYMLINQLNVDASLIHLIPKDFAVRNLLLPVRKENQELTIVMNDPSDYYAIDDVRLMTGLNVKPLLASKEDIVKSIYQYYQYQKSQSDLEAPFKAAEKKEVPVIQLVNEILSSGVSLKASDIHIDPGKEHINIRYRVDGVLHKERVLSMSTFSALVARIKIIGNLNITESRLPQDGRIKWEFMGSEIDLRISLLPTVYGEKIVIRILDMSYVNKDLSQIGMNELYVNQIKQALKKNAGLVLITGPTGSGKTSTLYAALNYLNNEKVNIVTIEDPVEYQLEGINQVQVNPKLGFTFSSGLRAILRQDPNIIMLGEMRDTETAEIAVRASLTGHLVLSTLHTNDALSSIPRLLDMKVEPYLVVSALSAVVAQRLVRKVCQECKYIYTPSKMEQSYFHDRHRLVETLYKGKGCAVCQYTGYKGRIALHEMLVMDDTIRDMLYNQKSMKEIKAYVLSKGMMFLLDDGLEKAKDGMTTLEEVIRVAANE